MGSDDEVEGGRVPLPPHRPRQGRRATSRAASRPGRPPAFPCARPSSGAPSASRPRMRAGTEPMLVDVRTPSELAERAHRRLREPPALRLGALRPRPRPEGPRRSSCATRAYRSSMAVGLAERQGFTTVAQPRRRRRRVAHGAACPPMGTASHVRPRGLRRRGAPRRRRADRPRSSCPRRSSPRALARACSTSAGAYAVLDVRPAWQFDEYHVARRVTRRPRRDRRARARARPRRCASCSSTATGRPRSRSRDGGRSPRSPREPLDPRARGRHGRVLARDRGRGRDCRGRAGAPSGGLRRRRPRAGSATPAAPAAPARPPLRPRAEEAPRRLLAGSPKEPPMTRLPSLRPCPTRARSASGTRTSPASALGAHAPRRPS